MHYFIAIELPGKSGDVAYGVVVPDIPGCFSAGDTLEEAITNTKEAIVMQLEDMIERKLDLPEPSLPEELAKAKEFKGWMFVGVEVDPQQLSTKAKRINVTIPQGVLYMVDKAAKRNHTTRSAFLTDAATTYMDQYEDHDYPDGRLKMEIREATPGKIKRKQPSPRK